MSMLLKLALRSFAAAVRLPWKFRKILFSIMVTDYLLEAFVALMERRLQRVDSTYRPTGELSFPLLYGIADHAVVLMPYMEAVIEYLDENQKTPDLLANPVKVEAAIATRIQHDDKRYADPTLVGRVQSVVQPGMQYESAKEVPLPLSHGAIDRKSLN